MKRQHLAAAFIIIQHTDTIAHPLHDQVREGMGCTSCAADVDEGAERQQRIGGDLADPSLLTRLRQQLGEISALECPHVAALPDMLVTVRIEREVEPPLL